MIRRPDVANHDAGNLFNACVAITQTLVQPVQLFLVQQHVSHSVWNTYQQKLETHTKISEIERAIIVSGKKYSVHKAVVSISIHIITINCVTFTTLKVRGKQVFLLFSRDLLYTGILI